MKLYPDASDRVSDFLKAKYEREAARYWDLFYKRNGERFFKDRHYLHNEWGDLLRCQTEDSGATASKVLLEVGCGAGNTIYPLLAGDPHVFVHACDFSPRAVDLVKAHPLFDSARLNAFVCDVTSEALLDNVPPHSVDTCTMVFVLSAISPHKMPPVLQNVAKVLKPGGHVLIRDYAAGDLAQERLKGKEQQIEEQFYVRGDGTRAFYFSPEHLVALFAAEGFACVEVHVQRREVENRAKGIVMDRRWIQATFVLNPPHSPEATAGSRGEAEDAEEEEEEEEEVELLGLEMFSGPLEFEERQLSIRGRAVVARCLPQEHQHTQPQTGLLLWDSAAALAAILMDAPGVCAGKRVVELGCGGVALCSLAASLSCERVFATDGDAEVMGLVAQNLELNAGGFRTDRIESRRLRWGVEEEMREVEEGNGEEKFEVVLGADVVYVEENVPLMFQTAKRLLATRIREGGGVPVLLLCHVPRRVSEERIVEEAGEAGFRGCMDDMAPVLGLKSDAQLVERGAVIGIEDGGRKFRVMCFTHEMLE